MTVWRMAMRCGSRGDSVWPACLRHGVAAIAYYRLGTTDLSKFPEGEPRRLWRRLAPSQKASLAALAYRMRPGDTIYVKDGTSIVCRGRVTGRYQLDAKRKVFAPGHEDDPFTHQVPVDWEADFVPVEILLGAEPMTVLELAGERLRRLEVAIAKAGNRKHRARRSPQDAVLEALEGEAYQVETSFRKRNRALIHAKKLESNGQCSVCGFSFSRRYKGLGKDCLVAHHAKPIGRRKGRSKTTIDDIDLLCPNCHAAVHTQDPPLPAATLRKRLLRQRPFG